MMYMYEYVCLERSSAEPETSNSMAKIASHAF